MMNIDYANKKKDNREKQETRGQRYGDQMSEPSDTLFLGNLSFEATEDDVHNLFAPFGTATGVRIPTNPEDGSVKGFGYVTFGSVDEAKAALEGAQGSFINNRPVRMDFASSRRQNGGDAPGRGGFGGRGGRGSFGGRGGRGGGRGDFGGRGGRGGGRGRGAPRGRGGSTNRGGFGDFSGTKVTF
jgi:nucleolin